MHKIEQAIQVFLENAENTVISEEIINEFGERCKDAIRKCLLAKRSEEPFKLRMSNIGKPLRQLLLEKLFGRSPMDAQMRIKMTHGHIIEALLLLLLRASGLSVETNKKVELPIEYEPGKTQIVNGELDLIIDGELYDSKSASPWSFDNKFNDFSTMEADDPFGYCGQAFGYSNADNKHFAGWIVFDKSDGRIKVVETPQDKNKELANKYLNIFKRKLYMLQAPVVNIEQINAIEACPGVIEETFNKRETGNRYLSKSCEFCSCKYKCHPGLKRAEVPMSKAKNKTWRYYTKLVKPD